MDWTLEYPCRNPAGCLAGDSIASTPETVAADPAALAAAKWTPPVLEQPPVLASSGPMLDRAIQSKNVLGARSPTVHYSPEKEIEKPTTDDDDEEEPQEKRTAVKAKAAKPKESEPKTTKENEPNKTMEKKVNTKREEKKPKEELKTKTEAKSSKEGKACPKKAVSKEFKSEPPTPSTSAAVAASLARQTTAEQLHETGPLASRSRATNDGTSESGDESSEDGSKSEEPKDEDIEEKQRIEEDRLSLAQVQAKKAAHARFVRFRRGFQRPLFINIIIFCTFLRTKERTS